MHLATPTRQPPDKRSADILALVRNAFAEKGFDGASMQDLARAAGMSVGNFYRYFPSKAAIVEQLIAADLDQMSADFAEALSAERPLQALRAHIAARIADTQACADGQLWAEITAAALRKPEIGAAACHMEAVITGYLTQLFAAVTGLDPAEAARRFAGHAGFVILLVKSAAMSPVDPGLPRDDLNTLILRTIDQLLDEIASASVRV